MTKLLTELRLLSNKAIGSWRQEEHLSLKVEFQSNVIPQRILAASTQYIKPPPYTRSGIADENGYFRSFSAFYPYHGAFIRNNSQDKTEGVFVSVKQITLNSGETYV